MGEPTWDAIREGIRKCRQFGDDPEFGIDANTATAALETVDLLEAVGARPGKIFPQGGDAMVFTWEDATAKRYYTITSEDKGRLLTMPRVPSPAS